MDPCTYKRYVWRRTNETPLFEQDPLLCSRIPAPPVSPALAVTIARIARQPGAAQRRVTPRNIRPTLLARLICERATSRSSFSGSVDSQGKTKIICGVHPRPFIDECITQLCVGLVEHVKLRAFPTFHSLKFDIDCIILALNR